MINKKWLILIICFITLYIFLVIAFNKLNYFNKPISSITSNVVVIKSRITVRPTLRVINVNDTSCYNEQSATGLLELDYFKEEPKLGKSIFFHETSCFGEEGILLNARQACAVESAAKMNPKMSVYLLYLSPSKIANSTQHMIQHLLSYKNIKIRRINADKYLKNTPLEKWYATGILKTSLWPRSHMSDILRYLTLWKYGGVYLDLDVVVIKSLEDLENFTGSQDEFDVAAGVLGLGMDQLGRKMANDSVNDLQQNFLGWAWGNNGPGVITRTLQKLCDVKEARNMTKSRCHGFDVFPPSVFYPIFYPSWRKYFELDNENETMKTIEKSRAIHVWNKLSISEKVKVGSNVPYGRIAEEYCPKVYRNCGPFF